MRQLALVMILAAGTTLLGADIPALLKKGDVNAASRALNKRLKAQPAALTPPRYLHRYRMPDVAALHRARLWLLVAEGQWDEVRAAGEAVKAFTKDRIELAAMEHLVARCTVAETRSEALAILFDKAGIHLSRGEPVKMIPLLRQLLKLQENNAAVVFTLGEIYGSRGTSFNKRKAVVEFKKFLDLTEPGRVLPGYSVDLVVSDLERLWGRVDHQDVEAVRRYVRRRLIELEEGERANAVVDLPWTKEQIEKTDKRIKAGERLIKRLRKQLQRPHVKQSDIRKIHRDIRQADKGIAENRELMTELEAARAKAEREKAKAQK